MGESDGTGRTIVSAPAGVDVADLEREIERRLASAPQVSLPPDPPNPMLPAAADPLERARHLMSRPGVDYEIGWQTPLLGQAWATLRETIHGEARLYVDQLMARQAEVDGALLEAIEQLRNEVAALRARLDRPASP